MRHIVFPKATFMFSFYIVLAVSSLLGISFAQDVTSKFEGRWEYYPGNNNFVGGVDISDCDGVFCKFEFSTRLKKLPCHKTGRLQIVDSNSAISRFLWDDEDSGNSAEWEIRFLIEGAKMRVEVLNKTIGAINREKGYGGFGIGGYDHRKDQWCESNDSTFEGEYGNKTAITNQSKKGVREYTVDCKKLLGGSKPIWAQSMGSMRLADADVMSRDVLERNCQARGWRCEEFFSGGDGSAENPYRISSSQDLLDLSRKVNADEVSCYRYAHYLQTSDIDARNIHGFVSIGQSSKTPFQGVYDGDDHKISNLTYKFSSRESDDIAIAGLFGFVNKKEGIESGLRNIHVWNGKLDISSSGKTIIGGLVASLENTDVSSSTVAMDISARFLQKEKFGSCKDVFTGGIVGLMENSRIADSRYDGNISTEVLYKPQKTIGFCNNEAIYAGGIAGYADDSKIRNTQSAGEVNTSANFTGIFAGGVLGSGIAVSIFDSSATNNVRAVSSQKEDNGHDGSNAGGIAAYLGQTRSYGAVGIVRNFSGQVIRSYSQGRIEASATGETASAGGLVANLDASDASIQDSYAIGNVTAVSQKSKAIAGGVVAVIRGCIQNAFAFGGVSSEKSSKAIIGGCVGQVTSEDAEISFCFYNKSENGMSDVRAIGDYSMGKEMYSNLTPLTSQDFAVSNNFVFDDQGFHFGKDSPVWYMSANGPHLIWQCIPGEQCAPSEDGASHGSSAEFEAVRQLTSADIEIGMEQVTAAVKKCAGEQRGKRQIEVTVLIQKDGTVGENPDVQDVWWGTPQIISCIKQEVKQATFIKCSSSVTVRHVFHI